MKPDLPPIGSPIPAARSRKLLNGHGRYVADIRVPGCLAGVFLRSPFAHARILAIDISAAAAVPGVIAVLTGSDIARVAKPFRGVNKLYPALKAPWQHAMAIDCVRWSGEPVVLVVARDQALAEDAAALVHVDYAELPAVARPEAALDPAIPAIHAEFGGNIALREEKSGGDPAAAFARAAQIVERTFRFGRHTGVPLESRGIVAEFEPGERRLTVQISHQCPFQMQDAYAELLGLDDHKIRVIAPDVGGGFGIKQQLYGDELAVAAAAMILERPIRFIADRLESMASDIQAREHVVKARIALDENGRILAFGMDDLFAIGPYSQYPRSSVGEARTAYGLLGAPYRFEAAVGRSTLVFQNKAPAGHYRGVGHPIACAMTEALVETAARESGRDPLALRRLNFIGEADLPYTSATGNRFTRLAFPQCLAALQAAVDLDTFRREIDGARAAGRLRGLGFAAFVEQTARGPGFYGGGDVRVSTRDSCTLRLEPSGAVRCVSSVTEQGQGVETGIRQVIAAGLGVTLDKIDILTGDSASCYHGGGTWASRSMAFGGEAAWQAARMLRAEILALAGALLQLDPEALDISDDAVVTSADRTVRLSLAEIAAIAHFKPHLLPPGLQPQLVASATYGPIEEPFRAGSGIQMSYLEVDRETGLITLIRHVVVHECGRVVNPLLVDEQIRGGVVQGLGAALFEECLYSEDGQLLNASLADYLVPMAGEMPDIELIHAEGPSLAGEGLGIVGVGEAGTIGAAAAVMNALNDALAPHGAALHTMPFTPDRVLRALGVL
jgi:carbon-monoxide dehydrogenase large subunit